MKALYSICKYFLIVFICISSYCLLGCGQTGPLYLPDQTTLDLDKQAINNQSVDNKSAENILK